MIKNTCFSFLLVEKTKINFLCLMFLFLIHGATGYSLTVKDDLIKLVFLNTLDIAY